MNEHKTVSVPVRWVLGDPEEVARVYLHSEWMERRARLDRSAADHLWPDVESILKGDGFEIGESGCYSGEAILGLLETSVNDCEPDGRWDLSDVVAVVYRYHDWLEVLVLKSFESGKDVVAFLVMGSDDFVADSLAYIEPDVVRAVAKWAFIENLSM